MTEYVHGFAKKEQQRLLHQARFLESYVYGDLALPKRGTLLEVGCGVGAQTQILLKRFPGLKIQGIDLSEAQLKTARQTLKQALRDGRVILHQGSAETLNLEKKDFSAAFICWFLEHVSDPLAVLKRTRQHLKPGAGIVCTEVFNQSLFLEPYAPCFLEYWKQFNDLQSEMKGHPYVGASLGHLLSQTGYRDISVEPIHWFFDSRNPRLRAAFVDYFLDILLSAEGSLVDSGRVTPESVRQMKREFSRAKNSKAGVFYYSFMRATAKA